MHYCCVQQNEMLAISVYYRSEMFAVNGTEEGREGESGDNSILVLFGVRSSLPVCSLGIV
jgi:hypothetical protein